MAWNVVRMAQRARFQPGGCIAAARTAAAMRGDEEIALVRNAVCTMKLLA